MGEEEHEGTREGQPRGHEAPGGTLDALDRALEGAVELLLGFTHPVAGPALSVAAGKFFEHRRERAAEVGMSAVEAAGREALVEAFRSDQRFQDLVSAAAEAGWRSSLEYKRIMLGRAVARAATDRPLLDESEFIVAALHDLDAPHLQTLKRMASARQRVLETNETDHRHSAEASSRAFSESHPSVRAALLRHGAVDQHYDTRFDAIDGGDASGASSAGSSGRAETKVSYAVSSFGERLLQEVEAASTDPSGR